MRPYGVSPKKAPLWSVVPRSSPFSRACCSLFDGGKGGVIMQSEEKLVEILSRRIGDSRRLASSRKILGVWPGVEMCTSSSCTRAR